MAELSYDIEQLFLEGYSPKAISLELDVPLDIVYEWLENENVSKDEQLYADYDPYSTVNS